MKIHLCCGDIYLDGYVNCDIDGVLVSQSPYVVKRDLSNYYSNRLVGHKHITYIDTRFDITKFPWPFEDESADEIVMIQAIEHFDLPTAEKIVDEVLRILVPGGKFLVDFPDLAEGVSRYAQADPEFMVRFIYCNHKNQYSIHHWGYTRETFLKLLGFGWAYEYKEIVHHLYPTIGCEATKMK